MSQADSSKKVFILGAGVSGLVTAWKLLERGWDVTILEKERFYGGMSRSWKWEDFILDVGPHLFHTPDEKLAAFWEKEFGDLFIKKDFYCKNVKGENFDEYYDYPLSYEAISKYPASLRKKIVDELETINPQEKTQASNYKQYVRALVGPTLQEMFFEKYPHKIWGIPTEEMTATWAPKRIDLRQKITPFYEGQWNAVGKYGTGCVYDRIYEKILALGGKVRLGHGVVKFDHEQNAITKIYLENGEEIPVNKRDVIVSTIPINLMAYLLGFSSSLRFRGITSVYLAFRREMILKDQDVYWLYFDSPDIIFNRVSEPKKFSADCGVKGKTCLTTEIAYSKGDAIDQMSEDELIRRTLKDLVHTKLVKEEDFYAGSVHRQPQVYPLLYKDYQHELAKVKNHLGQFSQLYLMGTTGEFNYADSQILFLKAFDTADVLSGEHSETAQVKRKEYAVRSNKIVSLNGKNVGQGHKPFIIAEAGLNHNGNLQTAFELIEKAASIGCDAIKFQTYRSSARVSEKIKTNRYAEKILGTEETVLEMFQRLELSKDDHRKLFTHAKSHGIEIFSTPFDFASVDLLESLGAPFYKLASFDLVNIPLIRYVAATKKPLILSTGMSTMGQIEEAVETIRGEGNPNVVLLHCVSSYPASLADMNLNAIKTMQQAFQVPVGLSDHCLGTLASKTALAIGAHAIERHFTLNRMLEGPDHVFSSEAEEMKDLVRVAGLMDSILGDGIKKIEASEYATINMQRKCLYAAVNIKKGDVISRDKIDIKGPGGGLQPRYFDIIVGRVAQKDIEADFPITWEDI